MKNNNSANSPFDTFLNQLREYSDAAQERYKAPQEKSTLLMPTNLFLTPKKNEPDRKQEPEAWVAYHLKLQNRKQQIMLRKSSPDLSWLLLLPQPKQFAVASIHLDTRNQQNDLNWLRGVNFIQLLDYLIENAIRYNTFLETLFSNQPIELNPSEYSVDSPYQILYDLKINRLSIQTITTEIELKALEDLLNQFCPDQAHNGTNWPICQTLLKLSHQTSTTVYLTDEHKKTYQVKTEEIFNAIFRLHKEKLTLFKQKKIAEIAECREQLKARERGKAFPNAEEALFDTHLNPLNQSHPGLAMMGLSQLSDDNIKKINLLFNQKIKTLSNNHELQKQLCNVHQHARHLYRRNQWRKWRKKPIYRFLFIIFFFWLSKSSPDKHVILYQVITEWCHGSLNKERLKTLLENNKNILNQHRSRWRRARFAKQMTRSMAQLSQLKDLLDHSADQSAQISPNLPSAPALN